MCSLISASEFRKDKNAAVIFDSCGAVAVALDEHGILTINGFKDQCCQKNLLLLTAHVNSDSLYEIDEPLVPVVLPVLPLVICDMKSWTPSADKKNSIFT